VNLDLSSARAKAEDALVDRCRILRDPQGQRDDVYDRSTNKLTRPPGDEAVVFEGPCLVSQRQYREREMEGAQQVRRQVWQVRIPLSSPEIRKRDVVLMLRSARPDLVGRRFRVLEVNRNSLATTKRIYAEDEQGAVAR
jgi:hypothetical protein